MSLRARLLVGMALVGVVLVVAGFVITRTTESYLIARVDDQLVAGQAQLKGGRIDRGRPPPGAEEPGSEPSLGSALYVGTVQDGTVGFDASPFYADGDAPHPAVTADEATQGADTGRPFT